MNLEAPIGACAIRIHLDEWLVVAVISQTIVDEVTEQVAHLGLVRLDTGKLTDLDNPLGTLTHRFQVGYCPLNGSFEVDRFHGLDAAFYSRVPGESKDQVPHSSGASLNSVEVIALFVSGGTAVHCFEPVRKCLDLTQRFLEVMGGDKGKVFEFPVAPFELQGISSKVRRHLIE